MIDSLCDRAVSKGVVAAWSGDWLRIKEWRRGSSSCCSIFRLWIVLKCAMIIIVINLLAVLSCYLSPLFQTPRSFNARIGPWMPILQSWALIIIYFISLIVLRAAPSAYCSGSNWPRLLVPPIVLCHLLWNRSSKWAPGRSPHLRIFRWWPSLLISYFNLNDKWVLLWVHLTFFNLLNCFIPFK